MADVTRASAETGVKEITARRGNGLCLGLDELSANIREAIAAGLAITSYDPITARRTTSLTAAGVLMARANGWGR